ncbi:hypothetical protein [Kitasatospora sp. NPDC057015]|uniref:hypothetical protein n=1 Tax=Kitasatospora sp. NPDC057015 TaxID=3346001 RepID=UPI00362A2DE4
MEADDLDVCRQIAFRVAGHDHDATAEVLAVIEDLLQDEDEYDVAVTFLWNLQNLATHGLDTVRSSGEIYLLLGPRSAICWDSLAGFWSAVAEWRARTGVPLEPVAPLLGIENEELRTLLWTMNRTVSAGAKLGLADAVRYEKAVGSSLPGYSHIALAMRTTGQG